MPTYIPITDPDEIAMVERWTRRTMILSAVFYVAGLTLWPFAPQAWGARYLAAGVLFAIVLTIHLLVLAPTGFKRWTKQNNFRWGVQGPALPYPLSLRHAMASAWIGSSMIPLLYGMLGMGLNFVIAMALGIPLFTSGMAMVAVGFRLPEPCDPSCPKCGYPTVGLSFPATCSECATPIPTINQAARIRRTPRPLLGWSGIALTILGGAIFWGIIVRPTALMGALPRQANLLLAPADAAAFNALDLTALTPDERADLIDGILAARLRLESYEIGDQLDWLDAQYAAGAMTPDQALRFASEGWSLGITTDTRPLPGGEVLLSLDGAGPKHGIGTLAFKYFVASITVNGEPVLSKKTEWYDASRLSLGWDFRKESHARGRFPQPVVRVPVPLSGEMVVAARIVSCVVVRGTPEPVVTWHEDGRYSLSPAPAAVHEVSAERVFRVGP
ncbi:MAG: hypothetical protein D6692_14500 [Planctomycetota bacterium]|nr:MAG: hypothetical protein D6692_14500 [Planctomycetota bacterium]